MIRAAPRNDTRGVIRVGVLLPSPRGAEIPLEESGRILDGMADVLDARATISDD